VNDGLLLDEKLSDYQAAFAAVDTDSSGDISAEELQAALDRCDSEQNVFETLDLACLAVEAGPVPFSLNLCFTGFSDVLNKVRRVLHCRLGMHH
jgi:hypothetical protein